MHFTTLFASLFLLATATATAIPNPHPVAVAQPVSTPLSLLSAPPATSNSFADHAFDKCKDLGIDPHGPHPKDFTKEDANGRHFKEGSKYSFWAAAQGSKKIEEGNGKRNAKSISIIPALTKAKKERWPEHYSLSITSGSVDPNYWRIHLKTWTGPGTADCLETYMFVAGGQNCYPNTRKFDCVQLIYEQKTEGKGN
ncbi:hypothetical protein BDD12DRAFT_806664 [Trichophaea hybrida]|nr:hypothetical protein BDD12DRAFT_806664 [Trichophaea hybrida]